MANKIEKPLAALVMMVVLYYVAMEAERQVVVAFNSLPASFAFLLYAAFCGFFILILLPEIIKYLR